MTFKIDLEFGQKYEKICATKIGHIIGFNDDYKYDFITKDFVKYECKADRMNLVTGNWFIEYSFQNKNSGVYKTEANYYILTNTIDYYKISVERLKKLIQTKQYFKNICCKIQNKYVNGYLFKNYIIAQNSENI